MHARGERAAVQQHTTLVSYHWCLADDVHADAAGGGGAQDDACVTAVTVYSCVTAVTVRATVLTPSCSCGAQVCVLCFARAGVPAPDELAAASKAAAAQEEAADGGAALLPVVEALVRERRVLEAQERLEEAVGLLLEAKADLPSRPISVPNFNEMLSGVQGMFSPKSPRTQL